MPHYKVFHPDHMMHGQNILAHEEAIGSEHIRPFFEKHGLVNIQPEGWYPEQRWLDVLSDLADQPDAMFDFVAIGLKIAQNADMPPGFETLPLLEMMKTTNAAYLLHNRGTDVGEITCEVVNAKHVKMILRLPSADDLWYGILYGYVRRFSPKGAQFSLRDDEDVPRRDHGGDVGNVVDHRGKQRAG